MSLLKSKRREFHLKLLDGILSMNDAGVVSNADSSNRNSKLIAKGVYERLTAEREADRQDRVAGQHAGTKFEVACTAFVRETFGSLDHLRPGSWCFGDPDRSRRGISAFQQFEHLIALENAASTNPELRAALGSDYIIRPDILISRRPEPDEFLNSRGSLVDSDVALRTGLRASNAEEPILHASISCKWTIRSDRAQNSRTEALNLVKNRKGRLPHIVVVTGEPLPSRIASIALGTGEIDCVYHFALDELVATTAAVPALEDAHDLLMTMIRGKRLRDISDLPLDLGI